MSKKRIAIIGDSTVEWIRPYRNHQDEYTYSEYLLNNNQYIVDIYVKAGMTSHEALILIWKELMGKFYDYYIFSFGINDCTPRSYPKIMADYYNNTLIAQNFLDKFLFLFYRVLTSTKLQKICSKFGISNPWISLNVFEKNIDRIISLLSKETDGKLIFISIPKTSKRVCDILVDINEIIPKYSDVIIKKTSDRVHIINLDLLFRDDYELYIPEGIHYSANGHRLVYDKIKDWIEKNV